MTPITPTATYDKRALLLRDIRTALATAAMLFSWAFAAHNLSVAEQDSADSRMSRVMLAACRLPDADGAYTWFRRIGEKFECGRYR